MQKYNHKSIEAKWQKYWEKNKTFVTKENFKKPKKYVLVEFPYPSGAGLHMGHLRPYVAGDVYSRFNRLKGFETIFPIGWDAFGLPAENYAIKMGVHPSVATVANIKNAKRQIQSWGLSFDWSREINTTDPEYYKWTQWLFLQFYKKGLAYEATGVINWCPKDKTGLANEEVIDGKCERCGTAVEKKELRQWYLRITAYAEKLLKGLKNLPEWPEAVKLQQENWIGKSTGAEISFGVIPSVVKISTTAEGSLKLNYLILHGRGGSPEEAFLPWLKQELESKGFKVQVPLMPGGDEPNDLDQAKFVKENCKIDESTVIIGHSFGGIVAMRLLEQGVKVKKVVFVSTPYLGRFSDGKARKSVVDAIKRGFNFAKIKKQASAFVSISDTTDHIVPLGDGEKLAEETGGLWKNYKATEPHFNGEQEPEVLKEILRGSDALRLQDDAGKIKVFTTRPDTIFGATYMVVAPEHPLVQNFIRQGGSNFKEVQKYIEKAKEKAEMERTAEGKEKTGVELKGIKAINPATKQEIPVWVADYVLGHYGTGAIMAVPAHDQRDWEFATKFKLPIQEVVATKNNAKMTVEDNQRETASAEYGVVMNSGKFDGLKTEEAIIKMGQEFGKLTTQYKLRDWVFSRQRYWGEPIPLIHCEDCGIVPVPEKDLPVKLPNVKKYEPTGTGESPLADMKKWLKVKCPKCKKTAWRETNTMPQWAGSSWYWLRYADPKNKKKFADIKKLKYWQPVDVYFGGMEHTTLHLLYSRFWNLFLFDQGLVTASEPYKNRHPHGIILGPDGEKMSKSRGNVVNPDEVVKTFGADTLRMYELFLGPHEATVSWSDKGVVGVRRFLDRVWVWVNEIVEAPHQHRKSENRKVGESEVKDSDKVQRALNKLIKKITEDVENFRFNTSISAFMEFHNEIKDEFITLASLKTFLTLLYPFAPHITEELNEIILLRQRYGGQVSKLEKKKVSSLQFSAWPKFDPALTVDANVEIIVQINGKVKGKITVAANSSQDKVQPQVLALPVVKQALVGDTVKRVIFVPNRLINLVI